MSLKMTLFDPKNGHFGGFLKTLSLGPKYISGPKPRFLTIIFMFLAVFGCFLMIF